MKLLKAFSLPKILLFLPFLLVVMFVFFTLKSSRLQERRTAVSRQVGRQFPDLPLVDKNGSKVKLDLSQSNETIIDFWFKSCPGCIIEMQQFEEALKGKEKQIAIISVCIDDSATFSKVMDGGFPALGFVKTLPNWHQVLLNYPAHGSDNNHELANQLAVTAYPSFFVLDKRGIIKETPPSAVNYIKTGLNKQNAFVVFLTSATTWRSKQTWVVLLLSLFIYQLIANLIVKRSGDKD